MAASKGRAFITQGFKYLAPGRLIAEGIPESGIESASPENGLAECKI